MTQDYGKLSNGDEFDVVGAGRTPGILMVRIAKRARGSHRKKGDLYPYYEGMLFDDMSYEQARTSAVVGG